MTPANKAGNKQSQKTTRERAAEARAKAEAQQRRLDTRNRIIGVVVVVALIALIFGGVWWSKRDSNSSASNPDTVPVATPDANAPVPKSVDPTTFGVPVGNAPASVPQLQIWEDFQCPVCGDLERTNGAAIEQLAASGKVRLLWRPANIIDNNYGVTYSQQATAAWGCAIDAGKAQAFHNVVYVNQPATEGAGWTQQQLLQFGAQAGIVGDAYQKFESCVKSNKYVGWAANSFDQWRQSGASGTPTGYLVQGDKRVELKTAQLFDMKLLTQAIADFERS